jgi:hypothetical protein
MAYLDVSPMITALRTSPEHFEFTHGSLHHIPSRHRFQFNREGRVRIDALCDCSFLEVSSDQEAALSEAFDDWRVNYWRAAEINREFASHFDPPTGLRRFLIEVTARLYRALLRGGRQNRAHKGFMVPAE